MNTGFVYAIHAVGTDRVKIGHSNDPEGRLADLQTGSPFPLQLLHKMTGSVTTERQLHARFASQRAHGEWFSFTPLQISRIKSGDLLSLTRLNLKWILPETPKGFWWDVAKTGSTEQIKLRWREGRQQRSLVFPVLQLCHLETLDQFKPEKQKTLIEDWILGGLGKQLEEVKAKIERQRVTAK